MAEVLCVEHYQCALHRGQLECCSRCERRIDCLVKPALSAELQMMYQTAAVYLCSEPHCTQTALIWLYPHEVEEYMRGIRIFVASPELDEEGFPFARVRVK